MKQKKGETLKSYINSFNDMSNFMTWSLDVGILAHLTNGVLLETLFWDELQQKEFQSMYELYRKAHKYLKLEDSNEAMCKTKGMTTNKKNDLGAGVEARKGRTRGEDKTSGLRA